MDRSVNATVQADGIRRPARRPREVAKLGGYLSADIGLRDDIGQPRGRREIWSCEVLDVGVIEIRDFVERPGVVVEKRHAATARLGTIVTTRTCRSLHRSSQTAFSIRCSG